MEGKVDIREFLVSRRAKVTPQQAGLPAYGTNRRVPGSQERVRPSVQQILDSMSMTPAYVRNGRLDILAANPLGAALYSDIFADKVRPPNSPRFNDDEYRHRPGGHRE